MDRLELYKRLYGSACCDDDDSIIDLRKGNEDIFMETLLEVRSEIGNKYKWSIDIAIKEIERQELESQLKDF